MDGCIANFEGYVKQKFGIEYGNFNFEEKVNFWNSFSADDFKNLAPSEHIEYLIDIAKSKFDKIYILTALPSMRKEIAIECMVAKRDWAGIYIPGIQVLFGPLAKDKKYFCKGPNHTLIDDNLQNIEDWTKAGGIAIRNKNTHELIHSADKIKDLIFTSPIEY